MDFIVDKHEIVKLAIKDFRTEINTLMVSHGFNFNIRIYKKNGYYSDVKVRIDIKAPSWFKAGNYSWNRSNNATKLEESIINRIINLIIDYDENSKIFKWNYSVDGIYPNANISDIKSKVEFDILFNGV